jgi:hypothetical protein
MMLLLLLMLLPAGSVMPLLLEVSSGSSGGSKKRAEGWSTSPSSPCRYGASLGGSKTRNMTFYEFFDVRFYKSIWLLLIPMES